eukprot:3795145-Amphidinium_carterae.1
MLTGILCEVVNATSEGEKVKALRSKLTEAIASIVEGLDDDMDGRITQVGRDGHASCSAARCSKLVTKPSRVFIHHSPFTFARALPSMPTGRVQEAAKDKAHS